MHLESQVCSLYRIFTSLGFDALICTATYPVEISPTKFIGVYLLYRFVTKVISVLLI